MKQLTFNNTILFTFVFNFMIFYCSEVHSMQQLLPFILNQSALDVALQSNKIAVHGKVYSSGYYGVSLPLETVIKERNFTVLKLLIFQDPHVLDGQQGEELLCCASFYGNSQAVQFFLNKDISVRATVKNRRQERNSALEEAVNGCFKYPKNIEEYYRVGLLLLEKGAKKTLFVEQALGILDVLHERYLTQTSVNSSWPTIQN